MATPKTNRIDPTWKFGLSPYYRPAEYFENYVQHLKPNLTDQQIANKSITAIFNQLDETDGSGGFSIERRIVAGSSGKRAELPGSDFELIIFLNNEISFKRVLNKLKRKLEHLRNFELCKFTPYSLQFKLNRIEFDLLPVVSFQRGANRKTIGQDPPLFEALMKRSKFEALQDFNPMQGSSLSEFSVSFTSIKSKYIERVIRLSKFWVQMVDFQGAYIPGRSNMIELMALWSNRHPELPQSVMAGFTRFLVDIQNFGTLNVIFPIKCPLSSVDSQVRNQRPLILDPSNPKNNFAFGMKPSVIKIFENSARRTLEKIDFLSCEETDWNIKNLIDPMK